MSSIFSMIKSMDDSSYHGIVHGCPIPYTWPSIVLECFNDWVIRWLLPPTAAWLFWVLVNLDKPWPSCFLSWSFQVSMFHRFFSVASDQGRIHGNPVAVPLQKHRSLIHEFKIATSVWHIKAIFCLSHHPMAETKPSQNQIMINLKINHLGFFMDTIWPFTIHSMQNVHSISLHVALSTKL